MRRAGSFASSLALLLVGQGRLFCAGRARIMSYSVDRTRCVPLHGFGRLAPQVSGAPFGQWKTNQFAACRWGQPLVSRLGQQPRIWDRLAPPGHSKACPTGAPYAREALKS